MTYSAFTVEQAILTNELDQLLEAAKFVNCILPAIEITIVEKGDHITTVIIWASNSHFLFALAVQYGRYIAKRNGGKP